METVDVCVEAGGRRVFASALDWPGWCRSGKTLTEALAALEACAPRYRAVAAAAGLTLPQEFEFQVVETLPGNATTEFGAPGIVAHAEQRSLSRADGRRLADLLRGSWKVLDQVASEAPAQLRKGPRGGGRDTDKVIDHVQAAEDAYARQVGVKVKDWAARRAALLAVVEAGGESGGRWPLAYLVRRAAWHVVDHAWEIEDRST